MKLVFPAPPPVTIAIRDSELRFPVNRIFCVGRNYDAHAREMDTIADRTAPFYFTKSPAALVASGATIPYPQGTADLHHEVELVVALGAPAADIDPADARACIFGYGCGLDMTRRDLQAAAKDKRRPWDLGKDFENSAAISEIVPVSMTGHPRTGAIHLTVNGQPRQSGDLADLVWPVPELIADLSGYYHLVPGDLIYTGTPAGIGPVVAGDRLEGGIEGVAGISLSIDK